MLRKADFVVEEDLSRVSEKLRNPQIFTPETKLVITDLDEVCVNITIKWARKAFEAGLIKKLPSDKTIIARKHYYIQNLLGIDQDKALALYRTSDYYDDLEPTRLGKGLMTAASLGQIHLVILSHCTPEVEASKKRFCKKYFPGVLLILVPEDVKKSKAIHDNDLNRYNLFIDDSPPVLKDIIVNTASQGKEFLCPRYGYNADFVKENAEDIANNGIDFNHFTEVQ